MTIPALRDVPGVAAQAPAETTGFVFNHTMLRVKDITASLDFYTRVLGFRVVDKRDFPEAAFSLYFLHFTFVWLLSEAFVKRLPDAGIPALTLAGLAASGHMERDLMHTYAASWWQTLVRLRLPAAWPFIFNALKINSTLALIGAIVAEFFGTPIVGMGFRISTEVGRSNVDMVWAEIAVAALAGSVFYGLVALAERRVTFWHPSVRGGRS